MEHGGQRRQLEGREAGLMSLKKQIQRDRESAAAKVREAVLAIDHLVRRARLTGEDTEDARAAAHARLLIGKYISWAEMRSRAKLDALEKKEPT